jgi:tetratricopeptide (TPR) repeat protein
MTASRGQEASPAARETPPNLDELEWASRASEIEPFVEHAERAIGPAQRRFALEQLERALLAADPGTTHVHLARLQALGVSGSVLEACEASMPPHAVHVPLVVREPGAARRAIVRALIVSYTVEAGGLVLGRVAERAVRAAIALAAKDAPAGTSLERLRLVPVQPAALAGVEIEGPSLAAAAYLSARALFSGRRTRAGLAVTGALEGRAVVPIDGLEDKRLACVGRGLVLLAPSAIAPPDDDAVRGVGDVEALAEAALETSTSDADIEAEVRATAALGVKAWNGYRWPSVREAIARTLVRVPDRRPELRVEVLARLSAAERHLGRTAESLRCIADAETILASPLAAIAVPDEPRVRVLRQKAMTLLQAFELTGARRAAMRSVAIARAAGLCALADGRAEAAVRLFAEALEHTLAHRPNDTARSRAYLVEALGRSGDARGARRHYELALREAEEDARRGADGKVEWVRTSYAEALHALGKSAEVLAVLDHPSVTSAIAGAPLPGLRARRRLGIAMLACAESERDERAGLDLLASSPDAYDALEPALRTIAHVNVLLALRHRLERGDTVDDIRLARSLEALPGARALATLVTRVREARGARRRVALEALLRRVERA